MVVHMKNMLKINAFILTAMAAAYLVIDFVALANDISTGNNSIIVIAFVTAFAMFEADRRISALESQSRGGGSNSGEG
jgi:hypothetical protein